MEPNPGMGNASRNETDNPYASPRSAKPLAIQPGSEDQAIDFVEKKTLIVKVWYFLVSLTAGILGACVTLALAILLLEFPVPESCTPILKGLRPYYLDLCVPFLIGAAFVYAAFIVTPKSEKNERLGSISALGMGETAYKWYNDYIDAIELGATDDASIHFRYVSVAAGILSIFAWNKYTLRKKTTRK